MNPTGRITKLEYDEIALDSSGPDGQPTRVKEVVVATVVFDPDIKQDEVLLAAIRENRPVKIVFDD